MAFALEAVEGGKFQGDTKFGSPGRSAHGSLDSCLEAASHCLVKGNAEVDTLSDYLTREHISPRALRQSIESARRILARLEDRLVEAEAHIVGV